MTARLIVWPMTGYSASMMSSRASLTGMVLVRTTMPSLTTTVQPVCRPLPKFSFTEPSALSTFWPVARSTTGRPISSAAAQASSTLSTRRPCGTGTPQAPSSCRVSSLSREMPSAIALVRSVSAVQIRRIRAP